MYTLTKLYAKEAATGARWVEQDLATALATDVRTFNQKYGQSKMVLSHDAFPGVQYLFDFYNQGSPFVINFDTALTVAQWFVALADTALPTTEFTGIKTAQANFSDAILAEFSVEAVVPGGGPNLNIPWAARTDLLVTHPTKSGELVGTNVLAVVGDYIHRTYYSTAGLYVMQGGRTLAVSGHNTIGLLSFANHGGCQIVPITESMLGGLPDEGATLENPVYVSVPDVDWDTHTAMLVLCGHLIPLGNIFKATGNGLFEINLIRYPFLENFLKAEKFLDLSAVRAVVDRRPDAPTMIAVSQARGRAFIQALLTISQSFVLVINSADVYTNKIPLEVTQNPLVFLTDSAVTSAVRHHDGRLMNYVQNDDTDTWSIISTVGVHDHKRMHDVRYLNMNAVDAVRSNHKSMEMGRPSILEIKRDIFQ